MYVIVQHQVNDPEFFFADIPAVARHAPAGVKAVQFSPSRDRSAAVCLWEAGSIEAVKGYLDPLTRDASDNTYFEVSAEHARGLPAADTTAAT